MTRVLITGSNGQLGQHLIKYFQENYPEFEIHGTIRHKSYDNQPKIFDATRVNFELLDLTDQVSVDNVIDKIKPNYIFNTSANAFVGESWKVPNQHIQVNTVGVLNILEAIRKFSPESRFVNLGTSEEFACVIEGGDQKQDENTRISPRSPYGCSKAAARFLVDVYRESYGLKAVQPWTFNFESKIRGEKYLTRKVSLGVARIKKQLEKGEVPEPIYLGNLDSFRSWQHCEDVADALWKIINQNGEAKDWKPYVISEDGVHSIREFVEKAFECVGISGRWIGSGLDEQFVGFIASEERVFSVLVKVSKEFYRPLDVTYLSGDSSLLRKELGWSPKITFDKLVEDMVMSDYNA